jgi:hypothetical protein
VGALAASFDAHAPPLLGPPDCLKEDGDEKLDVESCLLEC